jgi:hypothetical protein
MPSRSGTAGSLTTSTALINGNTYTASDGTNTTSFTAGANSTVADLLSAINGGSAAVTASLNSSGNLVLTCNHEHALQIEPELVGAHESR